MSRSLHTLVLVLLGAAFASPGSAAAIVASGAGPLPASAEDLTGIPGFSSGINFILGTLAYPDGVDMFEINVLYPDNFTVATYNFDLAYGVPDPEVFLFDANGYGVLENDDIGAFGVSIFGNGAAYTDSCLPAASPEYNLCSSTRGSLGPIAPGIYYLAITRSANSPLSNSGYIFSPSLSTDVVGPDLTSGGGDPIIGWDGGVYTSPDFDLTQYGIAIVDIPEPATVPLTAAAALALLVCGMYRARALSWRRSRL